MATLPDNYKMKEKQVVGKEEELTGVPHRPPNNRAGEALD